MDIRTATDLLHFETEKMQKVNLFESKRMFCDLYCLLPGQSQKVHAHEGNDKIYFVLEGEGWFTIGDESQSLQQGQTVCAKATQLHGVENRSDQKLTCLVFMAPHPKPERFSND